MLHIDGIAFKHSEAHYALSLAEVRLAESGRVHVRDSRIGQREFSAAACIDAPARELATYIHHAALVAAQVPGGVA